MAGQPILIAAFSGRAAGFAARRAGYAPLVADLFADDDTRDVAAGVRRVPGDPGSGGKWAMATMGFLLPKVSLSMDKPTPEMIRDDTVR